MSLSPLPPSPRSLLRSPCFSSKGALSSPALTYGPSCSAPSTPCLRQGLRCSNLVKAGLTETPTCSPVISILISILILGWCFKRGRELGLQPKHCVGADGKTLKVKVSFSCQPPFLPHCPNGKPTHVVRPVGHYCVQAPVNTPVGMISVIK